MDDERFDALVRRLAAPASRRESLQIAAGGAVAGLLTALAVDGGDAKSRGKGRPGESERDEVTDQIKRAEIAASKGASGKRSHGKGGVHAQGEQLGTDVNSMRAPWSCAPGYAYPNWRVINGYGSGYCHKTVSPCRGDEYYALDFAPTNGNAGGRLVFAPVGGRIAYAADNGSIGWLVKISVPGYLVHVYHLMSVQVRTGQTVQAGQFLGWVYNNYDGNPANNHLHMQVTDGSGRSIPFRLAGRYYAAGRTWNGTIVRNNALYSGPNFTGAYSIFIASDDNIPYHQRAVGNDNASSARVNDGCIMGLAEHTAYGGRGILIRGEVPSLAAQYFDNITSSLRLTC